MPLEARWWDPGLDLAGDAEPDETWQRRRPDPGKRTRTQFLGRRDAGAQRRSSTIAETAAEGVGGSGSRLPFLEQLSEAFGGIHDLSSVRAHVGGAAADACDRLGAEAYATGDAVAFRGAPDLHTAAHEAAHVIQQRAGIALPGGVGLAGDVFERHADAVADRVVAGQSAADLLAEPTGATTGGELVQRKATGGGNGGDNDGGASSAATGWAIVIATPAHSNLVSRAVKRGPDAIVLALWEVYKARFASGKNAVTKPLSITHPGGKDWLIVLGSDGRELCRFAKPPQPTPETVRTIMGDSAWGSGHGGLGQDEASGTLHAQFTSDWTERIDDLLAVFGPMFVTAPESEGTTHVDGGSGRQYEVAILDDQGRNTMLDEVHGALVTWDGRATIATKIVNDPDVDYAQLPPRVVEGRFAFAVDLEAPDPWKDQPEDDPTPYKPWTDFKRPDKHEK